MALGMQVLQDKKMKEEKKKTKSPMSPSSVNLVPVQVQKPNQNPYFKELCDKQRKIYSSFHDIVNRIVYDADQKRKKMINCEQFFLKLEEHLKILGGTLSQERMLDQIEIIEDQFYTDMNSLNMTPDEINSKLEENYNKQINDKDDLIQQL
jgi:Txe/YoeB family toxin of Txe-Axe toxin-antitoxin module